MGLPNLQGQDLIAWVERTASRWKALLRQHPEALALPCTIRETVNVAGLLQHIVAVELRYAERLADLAVTPYDAVPSASTEATYAVHQHAMELLHSLSEHDEAWWQQVLTFQTRSGGEMHASRSIIFSHLLLHSIRHFAQLATILREHGIHPGWMMDYIDMADVL